MEGTMANDTGDVTFLDADVEMLLRRRISEITEVPAGTPLSIDTRTSRDCYLYVVQVGANQIAQIYPTGDKPCFVAAGTDVRLPTGGERFIAPISGPIYALASPRPLED